jgi:hypothetical protein
MDQIDAGDLPPTSWVRNDCYSIPRVPSRGRTPSVTLGYTLSPASQVLEPRFMLSIALQVQVPSFSKLVCCQRCGPLSQAHERLKNHQELFRTLTHMANILLPAREWFIEWASAVNMAMIASECGISRLTEFSWFHPLNATDSRVKSAHLLSFGPLSVNTRQR